MDAMWKVSEAEAKKISQALNVKHQRMFIVDSGASFHMASRKSLTASERKTIKDTAPIPINTANGIIYVKKRGKGVRAGTGNSRVGLHLRERCRSSFPRFALQ